MYIPGIVISLLTFPGVIVHELAHQICCRLCRIPVYEVKYFRLENPCGYVIHESTDNPWKNLMTGMGPFFINTILGMIISCPGYFYLWGAGEYMHNSGGLKVMYLLLYWLGLSILMHAFPSTGDAKAMMESILKNKDVSILAKIITVPIIVLIYIGAIGSVIWLDLVYAIVMSMIFPNVLEWILFL